MARLKAATSNPPLHPFPQCVNCLLGLAEGSSQLAAGGGAPELQARAVEAASRILDACKGTGESSPEIANRILREIRRMSGVDDPYAHFKCREMGKARAAFRRIENRLGGDLRSRVTVAALGNSLDFFEDPNAVWKDSEKKLEQGIRFLPDQMDRLDELLARRPRLVLYMTDNSGEIYFDIPLYKHIRARCGRVLLVVKGGPALNDLTRHELESCPRLACFDEVVDTGTDGTGVDWSRSPREFLDWVTSADLIISKGMANFETLYPRQSLPPTFFIFKVKCRPIQDYIGAPIGSFVALFEGTEQRPDPTSSGAGVGEPREDSWP